jgi:hypothetical protein
MEAEEAVGDRLTFEVFADSITSGAGTDGFSIGIFEGSPARIEIRLICSTMPTMSHWRFSV